MSRYPAGGLRDPTVFTSNTNLQISKRLLKTFFFIFGLIGKSIETEELSKEIVAALSRGRTKMRKIKQRNKT